MCMHNYIEINFIEYDIVACLCMLLRMTASEELVPR